MEVKSTEMTRVMRLGLKGKTGILNAVVEGDTRRTISVWADS